MTPRAIRRLAGLAAMLVLAGAVHVAQQRWIEGRQAEAGARIFDGDADLAPAATLRGHQAALPAAAARCANCHRDPMGNGPADAYGGRLDEARLRIARPRHGGPAVAYGEAGFCRLLREGIDPNDVIVDAAMPRYAIDDAQCRALWQHLSRRAMPEAARASSSAGREGA